MPQRELVYVPGPFLIPSMVEDYKGNQLLLFASQWSIQWVQDRNKGLKLAEFGGAKF